MKKWIFLFLIAAFSLMMAACGETDKKDTSSFQQVNAEEAKAMMDQEDDYVILDVRTQEEYEEGHIPNAVLLPDYEVEDKAEQILLDKEQTIFVYCRSGNRSKSASEILVSLGYSNVIEFGGVNDWPYEIE